MTATATVSQDYRLAGRVFRPAVPMTAWQVGYFSAHLRAAKADALVLPSQAGHVESFDALVESLLVSEHLYHLLAAALTEVVEGVPLPWGNARADETARFLAGLTESADIAALRPAIWEVLAGFFLAGLTGDFPDLFQPDDGREPARDRGSLDLGCWGDLARRVAGYDWDRTQAVLAWPAREVCLAYLHRLRVDARQDHRHQLALWAAGVRCEDWAGGPPPVPPILESE